MTTEQIRPDVFIEESEGQIRTISPIPTNICVFIGSASENASDDYHITSITSYDNYITIFGLHADHKLMAQAIDLYFLNGGQICYVIDTGKFPENTENKDAILTYQYTQAMQQLEMIEIFNLLCIPQPEQMNDSVYIDILSEASKFAKRSYAFLLVDPLRKWNTFEAIMNDLDGINALRNAIDLNSSALYFPRLVRSSLKTIGNTSSSVMSPIPAIAGLISRIDSHRGVWKAPAGIGFQIEGVTNVEIPLTDTQNGSLNQIGVNSIRVFDGNIYSWGARTLSGFTEGIWKYVPVRRLALFIEESLSRGTQWAVFEPNEEPTWAAVQASIRAFMLDLFRKGAFQGSSPKEAFFVKCDTTTTTPYDQQEGILNFVVGFAPLKPAEFVIIKIQLNMGIA